MPCSKRGHSGDLEYKQIIASPAGKVNRYSPTKIALGKKSCDRIFGLFPGFGLRPNLPPSLNSVRFDNSIQYQT